MEIMILYSMIISNTSRGEYKPNYKTNKYL